MLNLRALALFLLSFFVYQSNFSYITHGDSVPNALTAVSLVKYSSLTLDDIFPDAYMGYIDPPYHSARSEKGHIVSLFGAGTPLSAALLYLLVDCFDSTWTQNKALFIGKIVASLFTSASVALLFLILIKICSAHWALFLSCFYAFATCVWSISSQALWQQSASGFYLILGIYSLFAAKENKNWILLAAIAFSMAVLSRPTMIIPAIVFTHYVFKFHRKMFIKFILISLPFVAALLFYNLFFWEGAFSNGQYLHSKTIALTKTGSDALWSWPFLGVAGLLFAPSVGILFFSPPLLLSIVGGFHIFRAKTQINNDFDHLKKYILIVTILLFIVAASWFDWWGGWSYGYRPLIDFTALLVILMSALKPPFKNRKIFIPLLVLSAWAIFVQFIGAFIADFSSWQQHERDVDQHHERLWSLADQQIVFYLKNFEFRKSVWEIKDQN
ncbi:MAG: hypothetical protein KBD78_14980 [Oligoflexales bacterium]|nr:hypothetical protein [Oligoflexales bacterium]